MRSLIRLPAAAAIIVILAGGRQGARGGPPFVTDDPEPVAAGHWEFYTASQNSKSGGDWSGTGPQMEINYGAAPGVQLHLIVPLAYDVPPQGAAHYGLGDLEAGAKIRWLQETNWLPEAAVFPLVELPTGSARDNLGNGRAQVFLPVWFQKDWGAWTSYGGGGYGINSFSGRQNWGFFGLVLQRQVRSNVAVGAEVYHQTAYQTDFPNVGTLFNVGTVIDLSARHHLLFSVGRSIQGPVDFQCYAGYQFTFDNSLFHLWSRTRD